MVDDHGQTATLTIGPVVTPVVNGAVRPMSFQLVVANEPLFRQRPAESFWYTHLPESQTMYVNFRRYESLGDRTRELLQAIDRTPPARLVIDLRQNGGGDFFEGRKHLVDPIKARPAVNQKGCLDPNWPDFGAGRDPAMDWILSQER